MCPPASVAKRRYGTQTTRRDAPSRLPLPLALVMRLLRLSLLLALAAIFISPQLAAQVRPDLEWRTIDTRHFRIHYTPALEELARRTASNAEYAYGRLERELVTPRGIVDIVLADNVDFANGYATPYPSNRIVIYARPPVETMSLRNHVDWNLSVVTHELAHLFHLDRSRGWWGVAQKVFGRAAPLFPNWYSPAWVLEGLAVHYETRIAGGGRLSGTEFPAYVRAAASGKHLPRFDELSLASPRFPGGNIAYVFGSYAMSRDEPRLMGRFVEVASAQLIPWRINRVARLAFGESFTDYWDRWRDSVGGAEFGETDPAVRTLTRHGFEARFPRYLDDSTLIYVASDARQTTGLYRLHDGDAPGRERIARRNTIDVNSPLDARRTVQGELDFTDPWTLRGDLYRSGTGLLPRRRLTRGERLSSPDVHQASGRVVAVQTTPGTTHLVTLVLGGDPYPQRLASGSLDRTWSEPRWSHDGERVVATRWERGGRTSIVVLDARGRLEREFSFRALSVVSSPVWVPGDSAVIFVSDHEGRSMIYRGDLRTGRVVRVWQSTTALNTPDLSPDGRRIAAVELGVDGYRVVTRAMPGAGEMADVADAAADSVANAVANEATREAREALMLPPDTAAPDSRYLAMRHMIPTWWAPQALRTDAGTMAYGFLTSASDPLGRHAYVASVTNEFSRKELSADVAYSWAGLGNPIITVGASQEWQHGDVLDRNGDRFGIIGLRARTASISALVQRPRVRWSTYAILGAEAEDYEFRTYPDSLLARLNNPRYQQVIRTQSVEGVVGFSTMQRPGLSVSVEDGIAGSLTQRARFGVGVQFEDVHETIAALSAAKSIPLPGYAKHVVAVRAAYGTTGHATTNAFSVGGVSGATLEVLPGVTYGDSRRTFFLRGFEGGAQLGVRAATASVEYRAPLFIVGRGISFLPLFFQKSSITAFADGGAAWCSFPVQNSFICGGPVRPRTLMASVGGELALDTALQYDVLYRFRLGIARPVAGEEFAQRATTVYFSLGSSF